MEICVIKIILLCAKVNQIYERALKELPGSYKLWYAYLRTRREQLKSTSISNSQVFEDVNNSHERALVFMHKVVLVFYKLLT